MCEEVVVGDEEEEEGGAVKTGASLRRTSLDSALPPRPHSNTQRAVLMRGPRIEAGVECCGNVRAAVSPATGRMTYRGRAMNRAARLAAKAHTGQVVCSAGAWALACADMAAAGVPHLITARSLGRMQLKGIGALEAVACSWRRAGFLATAMPAIQLLGNTRTSMASYAPSVPARSPVVQPGPRQGVRSPRASILAPAALVEVGVQVQPETSDGCVQTDQGGQARP
uniref:Guanylate cyclase domain-containing protein n=1 Tax=Chlamydomonas leiostraca TaxID=1034604 RepID=A0A7S0WNZ4_9CHLO